jgi:hypothetical protein
MSATYPASRPVGDNSLQIKVVAAAARVPGDIQIAYGVMAGIAMGPQNYAIGDPMVLALDGMWEIACATGTTASAGDNAFYNTSTKLVVTAGGANIIWIGTFAKAKTSGQLVATVHLNGSEALGNSLYIPATAPQALSGAGAVNVTTYLTNYTSTGAAQALTLAAGVRVGQLKKIKHIVDGGSGVLTPSALVGGTTITFTAVGEFAILLWNGAAWVMIDSGNDVGNAGLPALA